MRAKRLRGPVVFRNHRRTQCPACLDRDALTLIGRPVFVNGMKLSGGCEICGGTGEIVEVIRVDDHRRDPWVLLPQPRRKRGSLKVAAESE